MLSPMSTSDPRHDPQQYGSRPDHQQQQASVPGYLQQGQPQAQAPYPGSQQGDYQQQYAQQQYAQQQAHSSQAAQRQRPQGRLNVLGVIALAIQLLHAIFSAFTPMLVVRVSMDLDINSSGISLMLGGINLFWMLLSGGLALAGVLQKNAPRLRWTAIGALVVSALGIVSIVFSLLSGLLAPLFY